MNPAILGKETLAWFVQTVSSLLTFSRASNVSSFYVILTNLRRFTAGNAASSSAMQEVLSRTPTPRHEQQMSGQSSSSINENQQQVAQRSRWQAVLLEAGGIGAAVSEESMRRLKYCLQWLQVRVSTVLEGNDFSDAHPSVHTVCNPAHRRADSRLAGLHRLPPEPTFRLAVLIKVTLTVIFASFPVGGTPPADFDKHQTRCR